MPASTPATRTVLGVLSRDRLADVARTLDQPATKAKNRESLVEGLLREASLSLVQWLEFLTRDELKAACKAHGIDASGRSRRTLATRILSAAGNENQTVPAVLAGIDRHRDPTAPRAGDIVTLRHRQHLVEAVEPGIAHTRVKLICLDDDNQGRRTEVLWELELGASVLTGGEHRLGDAGEVDPPRRFGAYYNALRWNLVTATDARLFQAPFRAGIKLMNHQLTPLKRALELPRANLFIADDVGLGKTIEAGLVVQELLLRNQVELILIIAPASIGPQWQREMARRFGLGFELYTRQLVARRRQERGFGVNPWLTHTRFIISYQTLRRREHYEPLLAALRDRDLKSLLILDEAHTAAPSSGSQYATFSETTRIVQELAPLFDHRLFLSATPHNGHSSSFSTLLSLLDRQRFARGVKPSARALDTVMVRRLKADLRGVPDADVFPEREVVAVQLATTTAPELELSRLLGEYTRLAAPREGQQRLAFVNLQKRLLSSVTAFDKTLAVHVENLGKSAPADLPDVDPDDDEDDIDDDAREAARDALDAARSRTLPPPAPTARDLLARMQELARRHRAARCAKTEALVAWIRAHRDDRVIVFTEYAATKRFLVDALRAAFPDEDDDWILELHGGMSDAGRDEVQRAWNAPLDEHAARILVATDAAREGLNLQAHCADLFHFDVPWNPARMEQRNGRIDRAMQPAPVVRCHYFVYAARPEDRVLATLVRKVDVIKRDLGSLAAVVLSRLEKVLADGISEDTLAAIDAEAPDPARLAAVRDELESTRERDKIRKDIEANRRIAEDSRKQVAFRPDLLREVVQVGLELSDAGPLVPADGREGAFTLPELPESWQATLDHLRPPKPRDLPFWEWRRTPPVPVVFDPPDHLTEEIAHLHLSHPFVQRILSRFLAQGFSAHDLSRVTAVRAAGASQTTVLALARLSLFGPGAARLHDELLPVAAVWDENRRGARLKPLGPVKAREHLARFEQLLGDPGKKTVVARAVAHSLVAGAAEDFAALWPSLEEDADARAHEAEAALVVRATRESGAMAELIDAQQVAIRRELADRTGPQQTLALGGIRDVLERRQYEADTRALGDRLSEIDRERQTEPERIRALYRVSLRRVTPVGLVYLLAEGR